ARGRPEGGSWARPRGSGPRRPDRPRRRRARSLVTQRLPLARGARARTDLAAGTRDQGSGPGPRAPEGPRRRLRRDRRLRAARARGCGSRRQDALDRQRRPREGEGMSTRPRKPGPAIPEPVSLAISYLLQMKERGDKIVIVDA